MLLNLLQGSGCPGIACDMSNLDNGKQLIEEFAKAGRTGRRNALADVLGAHAECGTGDLTKALQQLQTSNPEMNGNGLTKEETQAQQKQ